MHATAYSLRLLILLIKNVTDNIRETAVGKLESGKLLLVTVDGHQSGIGTGMTMEMLAELPLDFGAVESMNLDGGGSTTMVIHNKVNRLSDQAGERPVSDAIFIFSKENERSAGRRLLATVLNSKLFMAYWMPGFVGDCRRT